MAKEGRDNAGRFVAGNKAAANKTAGLSKAIMEKTRDLKDVLEVIYAMAMNDSKSAIDRVDKRFAITWLTEYGVGKAKQFVEQTGDLQIVLETPDDLKLDDI